MADPSPRPRRVLLAGSTGTIGLATAKALRARGHEVIALARPIAGPKGAFDETEVRRRLEGCETRFCDPADPLSIRRDGLRGERVDAVVSCLASRTGAPKDAWAVDHAMNAAVLEAALEAGAAHGVLLSAICVQKPRLAFQQAKLAFERTLQTRAPAWSIVRPTAFFKSLSGQVERVRAGRPFLVFGDGRLTRCKPISDADCADFIADCLDDPAKRDRVLPVGGPGPAATPRAQGEILFRLLGREPKFQSVPPALFAGFAAGLGAIGRVAPPLAERAAFLRIAHYYATESMLVWDEAAGRYDADVTPEHGADTLEDHYARLVHGEAEAGLGEHAMFGG